MPILGDTYPWACPSLGMPTLLGVPKDGHAQEVRMSTFGHAHIWACPRTLGMPNPGDYQLALSLASSGKVDLKPLITHRFRFEDAVAAFDAAKAGKSMDGKVVIKTIISGPDVEPSDL
ncbi:hypothetical protein DFH11DRAFT_1724735 [Phellopilus nigrolimitatus]|nr:hypothetical protein DFH11DRAFT_1724735 [Phellopilus nigrolimitatus]